MQILICCATPGELKTVKSEIKSLNLKQKLNIHYLCTGIGNYETIYNMSKVLIQKQTSDFFLLNIGICGYWNKGEKAEKLIQIARIKNLHTQKELLPPLPFQFAKIASIISSEKVLLEQEGESGYVDMESWGFEVIADKLRLPRLLLKVPYDRVGEETKHFEKEKACKMLAEHIDYASLITKILARGEKSLAKH